MKRASFTGETAFWEVVHFAMFSLSYLLGFDEKDSAKGTWMGVDKYGRIGILLSITQPAHTKNDAAVSRGKGVLETIVCVCVFLSANFQLSLV